MYTVGVCMCVIMCQRAGAVCTVRIKIGFILSIVYVREILLGIAIKLTKY